VDIRIRPYQIDDIEPLCRVVKESATELSQWMPWCHENYSIDDTKFWVNLCLNDWQSQSAFRYLIEDSFTKEILGSVGLERIIKDHRVAELGYWVASKHYQKGIATKASLLAVADAFLTHGLQRVEIMVLEYNLASNKVAEKIGAHFEGKLRNRLFHNGESHTANCYSLIP
jgi:ribosomal-protein-serine acetyltransferase